MDLPLLVDPDRLLALRDQLAGAANQLGAVAERVGQLCRDDGGPGNPPGGWRGVAQRAFAGGASAAASRCDDLSRRLRSDAASVERCADQLTAELAILHRFEHEVMGALHRLAGRITSDVTGRAHQLYDDVSHRLPGPGSPDWRPLAARLVDGELL